MSDQSYPLYSCDDHLDMNAVPPDVWTSRAPSKHREDVPHVVDRDGQATWVAGGRFAGVSGSYGGSKHLTALSRAGLESDPFRPGKPKERMEDMERDGVKFSVMYPPIFGMRLEDKDLGIAVIQAYNDWAAEFEASAPDQFRVVAQLLPDDPDGSTAEMLRCAEMGIRQVNFLVGTVSSHMYQPDWDVFWDTAEANNITVNYHVGGPGRSGSFLSRQSPEEESRKPAFGMGLGEGATVFFAPFTGLFSYGVLESRPNLRICLAESGTGWIPFQVQEMDYRMDQAIDRRGASNYPLTRWPSEIFKKQVWATYQQDLVGLNLIPFFGEGHMMWASDYPHPDSTWPNSMAVVDREMAHLSDEMRQKITHDNAKAFYNLTT